MSRRKTSRFRGVCWVAKHQCWRAEVAVNRRSRAIGHFEREENAARAYDRVALRIFGKAARLNFPGEPVEPASLETVRAQTRTFHKTRTSSRYLGVWHDSERKDRPWFASIMLNGKSLAIGRYRTAREAAIAHDRAALHYQPKRVRLNFPSVAKKLGPASVDDLANELLRAVKKRTRSRFVGVARIGSSWQAAISHKDRTHYLGLFEVEEEAARAFDRAALKLRGKRGRFNFDSNGQELVGRVP